jgi:hypothetical protein
VLKFPVYWAFLNATFVFGTAMGVQFIVSHFKGRLNWVIIPALPMLLLCFHGAPSLPIATALNATNNLWLTSAGASISILLAILISYLGTRIFCTQSANSSFE